MLQKTTKARMVKAINGMKRGMITYLKQTTSPGLYLLKSWNPKNGRVQEFLADPWEIRDVMQKANQNSLVIVSANGEATKERFRA
jgi:hypothetical protein